jgi:hypothetical protein
MEVVRVSGRTKLVETGLRWNETNQKIKSKGNGSFVISRELSVGRKNHTETKCTSLPQSPPLLLSDNYRRIHLSTRNPKPRRLLRIN